MRDAGDSNNLCIVLTLPNLLERIRLDACSLLQYLTFLNKLDVLDLLLPYASLIDPDLDRRLPLGIPNPDEHNPISLLLPQSAVVLKQYSNLPNLPLHFLPSKLLLAHLRH